MRFSLFALAALATLAPTLAHHPHDVISAVAVSPGHKQDPTLLVAVGGTINLFLISRDGGYTWNECRSGLRGYKLSAIEMASDWVASGRAWVAMPDVGIQRTSDFGRTWEAPSILRPVQHMAISRAGARGGVAIFFATRNELFASDDQGRTDRALVAPLRGAQIDSIAVSPTFWTDKTIAVTLADARLLVSHDAGDTWSETRVPARPMHVCLSPGFASDRTLWVATWGKGVLVSRDGGASLSAPEAGTGDAFVNQLAVLRGEGDSELFAATQEHGVYHSRDAGRSWARTALHVPKTDQTTNHHRFVRAATDGMGNTTVVCGTFEGLFLSHDGGDRWREANVNPARTGRLLEISPAFAEDRTVVAAGYGMHMLVSQDAGDHWRVEWEFPAWSVYGIGVSPAYARDRLVMLGLGGNIVRSVDGGTTWQWVPLPEHPAVFYRNTWAFAFAPGFGDANQTVFCTGYGGVIFRSDDGGVRWKLQRIVVDEQQQTATPDRNNFSTTMVALSPDFARDQTLFVSGAGLMRSTDGGSSFVRLLDADFHARGLIVPPDFPATGELFGVSERGFTILTERGERAVVSNAGLEGFLPVEARLSPEFGSDATIWAATAGGGLFQSRDRGRHWQRVTPFPSPVDSVVSFVVSPDFARDQTMLVGAYDGYHRSTDGGVHWQPVTSFEVYDDFRDPWRFAGKWSRVRTAGAFNLEVMTSDAPGDLAEIPFAGTGIRLQGTRGRDHGIADLWIDGTLAGAVDLWAEQPRQCQTLFEKLDLLPGHHVLQVQVTGRRAAAATGARVGIDAAEVLFR